MYAPGRARIPDIEDASVLGRSPDWNGQEENRAVTPGYVSLIDLSDPLLYVIVAKGSCHERAGEVDDERAFRSGDVLNL
jgi:hypothetical protein